MVTDLNHDGISDLVVANKISDNVSVLLGNSDGTFRPAVNYPTTGDLAFFVAVADFDGDGNNDVIVTNNATASLTLLLGNGDGTFKAPINIVCRVEPYTVMTGDFNGDGKMDMVVTSAHQFTLGVFLGNGDGTFQAPVYYASGAEPHNLATSDFNGDGKTDIVVSDYLEGSFSVLPGNGDGTFQPKTTYFATPPLFGTPHTIALADFNSDGAVDVVAVDYLGKTVVVRNGSTGTNTDVAMPDVAGLTQAQATTALTAVGLSVSAVTSIPSNLPAGTVLRQLEIAEGRIPYSPEPGMMLPAGSGVALVLSSGPGSVTMVEIVDQIPSTASLELSEDGLVLGTVTSAASSVVQVGNIISSNPIDGAAANTGTAVDIVVSTGGVIVPNVQGQTQAAATAAIQAAGLSSGTVTTAASYLVPAGSVISENPVAGFQVSAGSSVSLVISTGGASQTAVPNVVKQTLAGAGNSIQAAGLVVGTVTPSPSSTVASGNVISESPTAGTQVSASSAVNLVISTGAGQAVPNVVGQTQAAATTAIQAAGLVVGTVTTAASSTVASGNVISESPTAGTQVSASSAVNLVVSTGAGQAVPRCGGADAGSSDDSDTGGWPCRGNSDYGIEQHGGVGQRDQ